MMGEDYDDDENDDGHVEEQPQQPLKTTGTMESTGSDRERAISAVEESNEEMIAEQYRCMALIEAKTFLHQQLGYDPHNNLQQQQERKVSSLSEDKMMKIRPCPLPTPKMVPRMIPSTTTASFPYSVPPKEIPLYSQKRISLQQQSELQVGQVGTTAVTTESTGQIHVRCLGCKTVVRVSRHATLVQCGNCHVVGPASSTRK
jgi:hypothetical protein